MANTTQTTCSRCGGSGHYSFNLRFGTVCFKCNGSGLMMVDLKARARNTKAAVAREAKGQARREMMIRTYQEVISEMNANYNFDISTELGIDQLNHKVWEITGKTIAQLRDEKLRTAEAV